MAAIQNQGIFHVLIAQLNKLTRHNRNVIKLS